MNLTTRGWAGLLCLALLVIYLPAVGHGFIKDDFAWIFESRVTGVGGLAALPLEARGFYRPVVSLTFAVNWWLFGLDPLGYGLTNLALVLAIALSVWRLGQKLGMPSGAALLAAAFWSLNFHGIRMSLLWISGRTALLVTLFSVLAAQATISGRVWLAAVWTLVALLSKEEAVLLPVVLLAWVVLSTWKDDGLPSWSKVRAMLGRSWPLVIPIPVYAALRVQTNAMTPGTAPDAYQFTFEPASLVRNALEYFDRAASLPLAAALVVSLAVWCRPHFHRRHRVWFLMGLTWMAGGYAITLFLPIRSSLYACLPSVGAALAGAAYLNAVWLDTESRLRRRMLTVGITMALVAVPAHWTRNQSWIRPAQLSALVMDYVVEVADTLPPGDGVLILDDLSAPVRLETAYGTLIQTAAELYVGRHVPIWIDPRPTDWESDPRTIPDEDRIALRLALRNGQVVRLEE